MSSEPSALVLALMVYVRASREAAIRERMFRTAYRAERVYCLQTGGASGSMGPQMSYYAAKIGANMRRT
jgi:hypothetical protein